MQEIYNKRKLGKCLINNEKNDSVTIKRIYWFDNIKFFLMLCVVSGHFIQPYIEGNELLNYIYYFFSFFTMPLFIFITGCFSKRTESNKMDKIIKYILLYLIMQTIEYFLGGACLGVVKPGFALWYLQAIVMYKLISESINEIKPIALLVFSFFMGLFIGFDDFATTVGSLSRIITMFPFYLLGYYAKDATFEKVKNKKNIITAVLILLFGILLISLIVAGMINMPLEMLYGKMPYKEMNLGVMGVVYRLLWYFVSIMISFSIIVLIPKRRVVLISELGTRTLQVYCLHILVFLIFQRSDLYIYFETINDSIQSVVLLVGSFILTIVLSLKMFSIPFDLLMKRKHAFMK